MWNPSTVHRFAYCLFFAWVAGCTLWTEGLIEDRRQRGEGGSTSSAATSAGTANTTSGAGGAGGGRLLCGQAPAATATTCPPMCNGGCDDGVCIVQCHGEDTCKSHAIDCPSAMDCRLDCLGKQACEKADLRCPPLGLCQLDCEGEKSCKDAKVQAKDGPVDVDCVDDACDRVDVKCGTNRCRATCGPGAKKPKLSCGEACACEACK